MMLFRLLLFLRSSIAHIVLSIMLGVAATASLMGLFGLSAYLIAQAALMPSIAALQIAIVGVRFFGISRSIFRYLERLSSHAVSLRLISELRVWFYRNIEPLAPGRLMDLRSGDLLMRIIEDIETLETFYTRFVAPSLVGVIVTAGGGFWTGMYSPLLAWILVCGLVLSGIIIPTLIYYLARIPGRELVEKSNEITTQLVNFIQGMGDLVAYGEAARWISKITQASRQYNNAQQRLLVVHGISSGLTTLINNFTLLVIMIAAIPLVNSNRLDGVMLAVITLVTMASFESTQPLPLAAQAAETQARAAQRLFDLVDAAPVVEKEKKPVSKPYRYGLVVNHLSFRYSSDLPNALRDISFDLEEGKWIALTGRNGAGKTTLLNLLLCLWDYEHGSIKLGGNELRDHRSEEIRAAMSVISQPTYLFSGTLKNNVLLAKPEASEEKIVTAIEKAGLCHWVEQAPQGLDTWIGEHGTRMSGGERQRLAIARVFVRDTPILLLDEPTAHLDPSNERGIIQTIHSYAQGRSLLWVTQRLAGLEMMDEILVMHHGEIVEKGKHIELMEKRGFYARMWGMQNKIIS